VREGLEEYEPLPLCSSKDVYEFMRGLENLDREVFYSIHVDGRNNVLSCEEVAKGCQSSCPVHPREVYKAALLSAAEAVIFVHNHPSGDPAPSIQDRELTARLYECGELLGIKVLDSVIIGRGKYYSMADTGELTKKTRPH
jgi:DNA repair protein RadC